MALEEYGIWVFKMKLKVAWICPYYPGGEVRGGAERHIQNLLDNLGKNLNIEVHVIFFTDDIKSMKAIRDNLFLHPIQKSKIPMSFAGITFYPIQLSNIVRKIKPDLVHAQMIGAPYGLAAAKLSKEYPTITTVHTMTFQIDQERTLKGKIHDFIWYRLELWEAKKIHSFIIVASNLEPELIRMGAKNIKIIPNGIEKKWFNYEYLPVQNRLLCVGRFQKIKGQDVLLTAFKKVVEKIPDATLHLVGAVFEGEEYLSQLKQMVKDHNLENNVKFLIDIDDDALMREYTECAVFVLPSREESHPIVLLEALASKRPVVATAVGGVPEMFDNGESGFLVEYGKPDQLEDKIIELLSNQSLRESMGEKGRMRVLDNSWEQIAQTTYQEYLKTIEIFNKAQREGK